VRYRMSGMRGGFLLAAVAAAVLGGGGSVVAAPTLTVTDVGSFSLPSGTTAADELSGLTWAGGSSYYAVSDSSATLYGLTVNLNPATGAVISASITSSLALGAGSDREGVAYYAGNASVYVSDETGATIREYRLSDGAVLQTIQPSSFGAGNPFEVFEDVRSTLSLESLSLQAGHQSLWTANEEALVGDGAASVPGADPATVVRLQRFNSSLTPAGQWAYEVDAISGDVPGVTLERSGVSDVAVLPNGKVLVLEREVGWVTGQGVRFRSRLYEVDFAGATDVSSIDELDGASYTPVGKDLLWEGLFSNENFEGVSLGPALSGADDFSLLLISDDQNGDLDQELYALRLHGAIPEPTVSALLLVAAGAAVFRRRRTLR
jgi:hypothetical protein